MVRAFQEALAPMQAMLHQLTTAPNTQTGATDQATTSQPGPSGVTLHSPGTPAGQGKYQGHSWRQPSTAPPTDPARWRAGRGRTRPALELRQPPPPSQALPL